MSKCFERMLQWRKAERELGNIVWVLLQIKWASGKNCLAPRDTSSCWNVSHSDLIIFLFHYVFGILHFGDFGGIQFFIQSHIGSILWYLWPTLSSSSSISFLILFLEFSVGDVEAGTAYGIWGLAITLWGLSTAWINDNLGSSVDCFHLLLPTTLFYFLWLIVILLKMKRRVILARTAMSMSMLTMIITLIMMTFIVIVIMMMTILRMVMKMRWDVIVDIFRLFIVLQFQHLQSRFPLFI